MYTKARGKGRYGFGKQTKFPDGIPRYEERRGEGNIRGEKRRGENRTGQDRTKEDRREQDRTGHNRTVSVQRFALNPGRAGARAWETGTRWRE